MGIISILIAIFSLVEFDNEIPSFQGQIQTLSEKAEENEEIQKSSNKFVSFLYSNEGKVVFLDIFPYYTNEDLERTGFSAFTPPEYITLGYESGLGGTQISISDSQSKDFFFDGRQPARRIKGYFKVVGVVGPNQGIMTIIIGPVSIQDAKILHKLN